MKKEVDNEINVQGRKIGQEEKLPIDFLPLKSTIKHKEEILEHKIKTQKNL